MARCFVYDRFLDAKTLPEFEHVFEFNTIVKIKEEVEHDPLDTETGQSIETSAAETVGIYGDPNLELHSTIVPEQHPEESRVAPYPKIVIKFRDLWADPDESRDPPGKRKKRRHREIGNEIPNECDRRRSKRRKTDLKVALKNRGARSLISKSKVLQSNKKKQNETSIVSREEVDAETTQMRDIWNLTRITHIENDSRILCECCGRSFPTLKHLEAHIRYYTADGIFHCVICNRKFNRNSQLKRHMKAMHADQPNKHIYKYKCQICHDRFKQKPGLIAHVTHLHHQRILLKKREGNWINKKSKSLTSDAEKTEEKVAVKEEKIDELDPEDNAPLPTANAFDNLNDENEQFIPASLRVEQEKNVCLDNEISEGLKNPGEVSIKVECDEETIVEDEFDLRGQISEKDEAIERLQEDTTQRNQPQRGNQMCLEIVSGNLQPQLRGNLIDHLGNTVGNWCVSESFDRPEGSDRFSHSDSTSIEVGSAVRNQKIGSGSTSSGSKKSTRKSISTNPADKKAIDNVARLALARNKRGTNVGEKLLLSDEVFDEQIGAVLSCNVLEKIEAAKANVTNTASCGVSKTNDCGETCESSDTRKEANIVSSKNIPLKNSSTFNAQDVVTLKSFNASCKFKVKDVRVPLVKLEDMIKSKQTSSLVEAKKFHCITCDRDFSSKRGLKRHCTKKHETANESSEASKLSTEKTKSTDECSSEALSKNSRPEEQGNSSTASTPDKQCHLCNEVFRNTFSIVSHYITVHTDAGVLRCCLCHEDEKTSRKLRFHLYKHFNNRYAKNVPKSCVSCAKELNIFSLSPCCSDCKEQLKSKKKDLCKPRVPRVKVKKEPMEKKYVSLRKKFIPSFLKDTIVSGISATDNPVAKNDKKVDKKIVKNFKCLACNRVFLESSRLKQHLLTAHVDVEYCKRETDRNVKSKIENDHKNTRPKLKVGSKRNIKCKSKVTNMRDKSCQKKLCARGRSKLLGVSSKKEQSRPQLHTLNGLKTCYNRKCNVCGLNCCCRACLKIHKKRYSSDGNNTCNKCGLKFAQKHLLAVHSKRAHNSEPTFNGKFKCQICTQGFYNKKFLRIHLAHFHNIKYLNCKTCGIRFNSFRELNNHRQYYSEIVSYLCSTCGQIFKCKFMLEYHNAQVHDYGELLMYKYVCDVCHCAFLDELLLQAHVGHFHKVKNRQSEKNQFIGNFRQVREQNLENTEVRIKTENDVPYSTLQHDALDETGKAVSPSSEYKCGLCKLSFTDPYAILNHEWEYSNDGKYACDICNRRFMTNYHLKNHKIKHYQRNAIRKYECYVCKEDFLRKNDLIMHGLHLHGPKFVSGRNYKSADSCNPSKSNCPVTEDRESIFEKSSISNTHESIGLLTSNNDSYDGKVLLFQKMSNNRSSMELLRQDSNENFYSCEFCQANFNSASLLKDHVKKHVYHAYYTNLSRYLCLICKNKFRTNDILRAHVVYSHTSGSKQSTLGERLPDESIQLKAINISKSSPLTHPIPDSTSLSERDCNSICQPNITLSEPKEQLVHRVDNMNAPQAPRVRRTYSARKTKAQINNNSECNDTNGNENKNSGRPNPRRKRKPKFGPRGEFGKTSEAIQLFTIKAENTDEPRKYTCIICSQTFDSVARFGEHFASVHFQNQAYICALCDEKFVYMSHLKHHISTHEENPKHYVCCNNIFSEITDLIYHKQTHPKQDEKDQGDPNENLTLSVRVGSFQKSNVARNIHESINMCKCEICDAAFSDFRILLKHWDSCINKNCLQCDFCGARFKGQRFLEVHKLSCHHNKQNSNILEKSWSTTSQNNMSGGRIIVDNSLSVNPNPFKEERRCYGPANKLSTQSKASNNKQNTKCEKAIHLNAEQVTNANVSTTKPQSNKAVVSSNRPHVSASVLKKMLIENFEKRVSLNMNSNVRNPLANKSNKQISSEIPHKLNDSRLSNHHIGDRSNVRNNFSPREEWKNRSLLLNTVKNASSVKPTIRNSTRVKDARVESGEKCPKNDGENTESSNPKPQSSITNDSQDYYESVQYLDDRFISICDTSIIPSRSDKTPHSNEHNRNDRVSDLPALPSNSEDSFVYYLCIQPSSDDSDESSDETLLPNDPNFKSRRNDIQNKQLLRFLQKTSSAFAKSMQSAAAQEITDNSIKNRNKNVKSNAAAQRLHTNVNKNKKVPVPSSLTANSTHAAALVSHVNATQDIESPRDDSDSDKEPEPVVTNRNFRCSYCFAWFSEREQLTKHLEAHKTARQCPACGIVFSNDNALRHHLPEHECSVCTRCGMAVFFKDAQSYHEGTRKHCPLCKSLLPVPSRKYHQSPANSEQQVMKCGVCMEAFDSMSKLSAHFRLVHLSFVCLICDARFSTKYTLRKHLHTHDEKKTTSVTSGCKVCTNNFAEEVNLEDDPSSDGTVQADE